MTLKTKIVSTLMQGRYASQIACSIAAANNILDDDERLSPKAIAVRSCDIAHQLSAEMSRRGWYQEVGSNDGIPLGVDGL